jgi:prevent-host-death family protein
MSVSTIHEAKTNLSHLIQKAERGEEVVIARGKTPVAKIVPIKKAKKAYSGPVQRRLYRWTGVLRATPRR